MNGAHALADMLLHPAIEGETAEPPATPGEGECWLVDATATGVFLGKERCLAGFQSGSWLFAEPRDGMRAFDKSSGQILLYAGEWRRGTVPAGPAGGTTVDQEARDAIGALIAVLRDLGTFPR